MLGIIEWERRGEGSQLKRSQNKNIVVDCGLIDLQIIPQDVLIVIRQFIIVNNSVTSTRNTFQTDFIILKSVGLTPGTRAYYSIKY